ncbi:MAG: translation initiation factor IF-2, partial [Alphaproteobacteria bacterium]
MSEEKKLTLASRKTLGVKTTVETGRVRQSFSHGRSKPVVVEVKRKRVLRKPGEAEAEAEAPATAEPASAPAPAGAPASETLPPPAAHDLDGLTADEITTRQAVAKAAMKQAE